MTCEDDPMGRFEANQPQCGKDFCDLCGDCLDCYGEDLCYGVEPPGDHPWVVYDERPSHESQSAQKAWA